MKNTLPPRDWRKNWYNYIGHFALGCLTGVFSAFGDKFSAALLFVGFIVYQGYEYWRRGKTDTPARDVADYLIGLILVLILSLSEGF